MYSSLRDRFPKVLTQLLPNHTGSPGETGRCRHQIASDRSNPRNDERKQFQEPFLFLNYLEWTITRRAVAEYGGNKSRAAKVLGRTYRWLRKLESEMTGSQSSGHNPSNKS
jgi:hypothetical protein